VFILTFGPGSDIHASLFPRKQQVFNIPVDVAGLDPGEQRQAVSVSDHRTQFSPITIFENLEI
jgi:hypothetical protein